LSRLDREVLVQLNSTFEFQPMPSSLVLKKMDDGTLAIEKGTVDDFKERVDASVDRLVDAGLLHEYGYNYNQHRLTDKGRKALGETDFPPRVGVKFESAHAGYEFRHDMRVAGKAVEYLTDGRRSAMLIGSVYPPLNREYIWNFSGMSWVVHKMDGNQWRFREDNSGREWRIPMGTSVHGKWSQKKLKRLGLDKPDSEIDPRWHDMKKHHTEGTVRPKEFHKETITRKIITDILVPLKHSGQFEFVGDMDYRYAAKITNTKPTNYETTNMNTLDGREVQVLEAYE